MQRHPSNTLTILAEALVDTMPSMTDCFRWAFNSQMARDTWEVKAQYPSQPRSLPGRSTRSFDVI